MKPSLLLGLALTFAALLLAPPRAAAALRWETLAREAHADSGDENVTVSFPFTNSGSAPVSIASVEAGCSCTTAKPSKPSYAPGERGEIAVIFTLGERVGRQERRLFVSTNEPAAQPQELSLIVEIAELVQMHPRLLYWAVGDALTEKSVTITLTRPAQTNFAPPAFASPDFTARLLSTDRPEIFLLHLKPTRTSAPTSTAVHLKATISGKLQALTVFAAVR